MTIRFLTGNAQPLTGEEVSRVAQLVRFHNKGGRDVVSGGNHGQRFAQTDNVRRSRLYLGKWRPVLADNAERLPHNRLVVGIDDPVAVENVGCGGAENGRNLL